ncbi:MAG: hypothetical protein J5621_01550 [Paludibacteraceae bacterium]|nr:hypothetical protein [Paludibacteraceae bacterium]
MKIKLNILLLLTLFAINIPAQEMPGTANCFGERVIQDYLSFYENQQKEGPKLYSAMHLWFEDSDTRHMTVNYINLYNDSTTTDTIFFIHVKSAWGEVHSLEIVPGDTLLGLNVKWLDGGYRSFEAYITPFLNEYSKTYWEDLCKWDTAHISSQLTTECVVLDGPYYYLVRLIYQNGFLLSAEFCHHGSKCEYEVLWHDMEKYVDLPYPESKQWPKILE